MVNPKVIEEVEHLEEQIQAIKWAITNLPTKKLLSKSIVKETSGMLGKGFPCGVSFENRIRKSWEKRTKRLGL